MRKAAFYQIGAAAMLWLLRSPDLHITAEPDPVAEAKDRERREAERQQRKAEREERDRRAAHVRKWGAGRYLPHQGAREIARRARKAGGDK